MCTRDTQRGEINMKKMVLRIIGIIATVIFMTVMISLIASFPRYLSNATRAIYEFGPWGITRFISPSWSSKLLKGDEEALRLMARVFIGTLMFWAAVYLRNNPKYAGEKWYEIKI